MDFEPKGFRLHPSIRKGSKYRAEIPQRNYKPKITLTTRGRLGFGLPLPVGEKGDNYLLYVSKRGYSISVKVGF